jgi:hypothetical protein
LGLFNRPGGKLAEGPTLLLPSDSGPAFLDAARLYDPAVRRWMGRLVFSNGVLLFGPVALTPKLAAEAGLPSGTGVAWYVRAAVQDSRGRRPHAVKMADGERLIRGLAARLGGSTHPGPMQPDVALLASVYSERAVPFEQVIEVLSPYSGALTVEDAEEDTYALTGKHVFFYTAYWSPRRYLAWNGPPALGELRQRRLHHWDLHTGMRATHARRELRQRVGEAALALATHSGGVAIDMLGFRFATPDALLSG